MANVRIQIRPYAAAQIPLTLTIEATLEELKDYYAKMSPSHALAHRLHDAAGTIIQQLEQAITADVETT